MSLPLRWTEQAAEQLGSIAEYISLTSPVYAEQVVDRIVLRLRQAQDFPESGRRVPEAGELDVREVIERPYRLLYRVRPTVIEVLASCMRGKISAPRCRADSQERPDNVRCN